MYIYVCMYLYMHAIQRSGMQTERITGTKKPKNTLARFFLCVYMEVLFPLIKTKTKTKETNEL